MSACLRPTCGRLDTVLSIFATRTRWSSLAVLPGRTLNPVSGQYWVTVWPPSTFCGVEAWACGLGLDPPLHAVSTRPVAVRADRVRTTRRTSSSPWGVGPSVTAVCHLTGRQPTAGE